MKTDKKYTIEQLRKAWGAGRYSGSLEVEDLVEEIEDLVCEVALLKFENWFLKSRVEELEYQRDWEKRQEEKENKRFFTVGIDIAQSIC